MDEQDLDEEFKNKPEQKEHIKATAETFTCPKRNVKMYAVPVYESFSRKSSDHNEIHKRILTQEDTNHVKPSKVPKADKAAGKPAAKPTELKCLTNAQTKTLTNWITKADKALADADESESMLEEAIVKDCVPQRVQDNFLGKVAELRSCHADVHTALVPEWQGKVKEIMARSKSVLAETVEVTSKFTRYVEDAW